MRKNRLMTMSILKCELRFCKPFPFQFAYTVQFFWSYFDKSFKVPTLTLSKTAALNFNWKMCKIYLGCEKLLVKIMLHVVHVKDSISRMC